MAEEGKVPTRYVADIQIKKCARGFVVIGSQYGGEEIRAFSTPEGLIEWLSRELGCGPIVWSLTLDFWADLARVKPDDMLPLPDPGIDPRGYQEAVIHNSTFLLNRFVDKILAAREPQPPPEPKPKKEKKEKGKKTKVVGLDSELNVFEIGDIEEEKPKEEVKEE